MISSADTSAIGRGLEAFGAGISAFGEKQKQQQNVVDLSRAEAVKTQRFLDLQNQFEQDGDYSTFGQRAGEGTRKAVSEAGNLIRDKQMREKWLAQSEVDIVRTNDSIIDRGATLRRQAETNALDEALEANRRLYVDPLIPEDVKAKARNEIIGAIDVAGQAGLLTPDQADARKKLYVEGADFNRGALLVEKDPSAVLGDSDAAALLRRFEGFRETPYWDVNAYRTGYGSDTITKADGSIVKVAQGDKISRADAERDLARRTKEFEAGAISAVGQDAWASIPAQARAALVSVAYNYGSLPKSVVEAAKSGNVETIASAVEGLKGHNGGVNAKRRTEEAAIIRGNAGPDWFKRLSPEDQAKLRKQAETRQNQINVETRGAIDVAAENAPTAILNTGKYDGQLPSLEQFQSAYGPVDGSERYGKFRAAVETSEQAYGMRTMSSADIEQLVQSSAPRSSGNDAALEQARYDALSKAAAATLKAREADPASYARQVFPSVSQAWTSIDQEGGAQAAIAASLAAQQQLGIAKVKPLPKDYADSTIAAFKDETLSEAERINSVAGVLMATADPTQQRAIFEQMVEAGLPDMTEGAFVAMSRGDTGAANRLFRAALVDPSKLPGKAPEAPAAIDGKIQTSLMDENQIGDLYYGLSDGSAENLVRAQRDAKLLNNAVNIRLRNGETLDAAVSGAARDLYGDVKPVTGDSRVNAQILLPADQDEAAVLEGLAGVLPQVETALTEALAVPSDAPTADSTRAILDATGKNYIANVMAEGYFRNAGQGFVFIDPFTGTAVPDKNGQAMIFSLDQVEASRPLAPPMILPSDQPRTLNENVQGEMQQQEDRVRQMYEGAAPAVDPDGFPIDLGRVKIQNEDGSFSTEETTTVEIDGRWVNVPTIWDGKRLNEDAAVDRARAEIARGAIFPNYDTLKDAEAGARRRSDYLGKLREAK